MPFYNTGSQTFGIRSWRCQSASAVRIKPCILQFFPSCFNRLFEQENDHIAHVLMFSPAVAVLSSAQFITSTFSFVSSLLCRYSTLTPAAQQRIFESAPPPRTKGGMCYVKQPPTPPILLEFVIFLLSNMSKQHKRDSSLNNQTLCCVVLCSLLCLFVCSFYFTPDS